MSSLSSILSPRNVTLFVFILVVLFLGATFNVQVGPESFVDVAKSTSKPNQGMFGDIVGNDDTKSKSSK